MTNIHETIRFFYYTNDEGPLTIEYKEPVVSFSGVNGETPEEYIKRMMDHKYTVCEIKDNYISFIKETSKEIDEDNFESTYFTTVDAYFYRSISINYLKSRYIKE